MRTITFTKEEVDGMLAMCKNQVSTFDELLVKHAQLSVGLSPTAKKNRMFELEGKLHKSWKCLREIQRKLGHTGPSA